MNHISIAFATVLATVVGIAAVTPAAAGSGVATPPRAVMAAAGRQQEVAPPRNEGVVAVVIKGWGQCGSRSLVWDDLNRNWQRFGNTRVYVDFSNPDLCGSHFTYDALVASGAQTVIVSDADTSNGQFSDTEARALARYVREGHNLIGTFLSFQWAEIDNRAALAPLFGLDPTLDYVYDEGADAKYRIRARIPLFKHLDGHYDGSGTSGSQVPSGGRWTPSVSGDAKIIAYDAGHESAILSYCGSTYRALYFASMPEYESNDQDEQVVYNAIVSGLRPACGGQQARSNSLGQGAD